MSIAQRSRAVVDECSLSQDVYDADCNLEEQFDLRGNTRINLRVRDADIPHDDKIGISDELRQYLATEILTC